MKQFSIFPIVKPRDGIKRLLYLFKRQQEGKQYTQISPPTALITQPTAATRDSPSREDWNQNGIVDKADSIVAWTDTGPNRTLTITGTGGVDSDEFVYIIEGIKFTATEDSVQIDDTNGLWLIFYDGTVLTALGNPTRAQVNDVIENKCWISSIYWNSTLGEGKLFEERHGTSTAPNTHKMLHDTVGTRWSNGIELGNLLTDKSGNDNLHAQFSNTSGVIYDEDLEHDIFGEISTEGFEIFYLDSGVWQWDTNAGYSVIDDGFGLRLAYNNGTTPLMEVGNNKFVLCHIFATNIDSNKLIAIVGQAEYNTVASAEAGASNEIEALRNGPRPTEEFLPIATVIFQTSTSYNNTTKARTRSLADGSDYIDWRQGKELTGAGGVSRLTIKSENYNFADGGAVPVVLSSNGVNTIPVVHTGKITRIEVFVQTWFVAGATDTLTITLTYGPIGGTSTETVESTAGATITFGEDKNIIVNQGDILLVSATKSNDDTIVGISVVITIDV